ncbi:MAG TPA: TrkA family potassium uptake protein [Acidimicrobiales bacterium]|nr:TrkA family potassium uptake protein [Acidimicrobiales bacterium]
MHVIVVGCGRVGSELAVALVKRGHSAVIIDKDPRAFRRLPPEPKVPTVVGPGFDRQCLEQAQVGRAGALAAVTSGDNSNILCARIAHETYEIPNVVARIYDPRRAEIYQRLGIPTVATVTWTTDQVLRRLFPDETVTEWDDPTGQVALVERDLPEALAGRPLESLCQGAELSLAAVARSGEVHLDVRGLIGQEGDILYLMARRDALAGLDKRLASAAHAPA